MVPSPGKNGRKDIGSHEYGQASLGFQFWKDSKLLPGHRQCTPCPAWNIPSPCLPFPFIWPWLQCRFPIAAWPGHPRQLGDVPEPRPLWAWGCSFYHRSIWGPTPAWRDPQGSRPRVLICLPTPFPQPESWRTARQGGQVGCPLHPSQRAAPLKQTLLSGQF